MIEVILPAGAASAELLDDRTHAALFAEEEASLGEAAERRRREFANGRLCSRGAMAKLGVAHVAIPRGRRGEPLWPPGIVGSITHCAGYCAATAGRAGDFATFGIDAEPDRPLGSELLGLIADANESDQLRELARARPRGLSWDKLLFCAKEAAYKAWFPLTNRWLGFEDVAITIDPVSETFAARLLVPAPSLVGQEIAGFAGRWLARDSLIIATIAVPHERDDCSNGPRASRETSSA